MTNTLEGMKLYYYQIGGFYILSKNISKANEFILSKGWDEIDGFVIEKPFYENELKYINQLKGDINLQSNETRNTSLRWEKDYKQISMSILNKEISGKFANKKSIELKNGNDESISIKYVEIDSELYIMTKCKSLHIPTIALYTFNFEQELIYKFNKKMNLSEFIKIGGFGIDKLYHFEGYKTACNQVETGNDFWYGESQF